MNKKNSKLRSSVHYYPISSHLFTTEFYYVTLIAQMSISASDVPSAYICIFSLHLFHLHSPIAPLTSKSWQWRRWHEQAASEWPVSWPASQNSWDGWLTAGQPTKSMLSSYWRCPGSVTLIWAFLLGQASDFAECVGILLSSRAQCLWQMLKLANGFKSY